MRILVIGGTSFIGPHVVNLLKDKGHQVVVFHRGSTKGHLPKEVHHILGERKNMIEYTAEFKKYAPDVVLDMIPSTEEDARTLINTFRGICHRIVAISSQDVYRAYGLVRENEVGAFEPIPITEQSCLRQKLYPYQDPAKDKNEWTNKYDKILVERVIMDSAGFAGTILRLPAVYGPKDGQHRFFSYLNLKRMHDKRPYLLMDEEFAQWRWTHSYVENVAYAIVLAITNGKSAGRVYNVGEPDTPSMFDFVSEIGKILGWRGEIVLVPKEKLPDPLKFPLNTMQQLVVDSQRIREELDYHEKVARKEALKRTIVWEFENIPKKADPKFNLHFDYDMEDEIIKGIRLL